jgi:hypothetical protein
MNGRDAGSGMRDAELQNAENREQKAGTALDCHSEGATATEESRGAANGTESSGHEMSRREAMGLLAVLPLGLALPWAPEAVRTGVIPRAVPESRVPSPASPKFFSPHEYDTVRVLVDLIIPRDERSGSATDAGVPEFIDFMMTDRPNQQTEIRGGLAWMDAECMRRFGKTFVDCADAERRALLDDIAWPKKARPEMSQGVAFFNRIRDLTASGFWSSKMGVEDLQYRGNTYVREWTGCPPAALEKLGVHY